MWEHKTPDVGCNREFSIGLDHGCVSSPYFFALSMVEVTEYIQDGVPFCMLFYGIVLLYEWWDYG